jgi:predicted transcriptional regulator
VIRALSKGKDVSKEKVADYMTAGRVHSCKEDDTVGEAAKIMKKYKVNRLAVMDHANKLSGLLSFGHVFRNDVNADEIAEVVTRGVNNRNNGKRSASAS